MTTQILGTGSYAPEKVVTNDDLAQIVDTSDEWIQSRTGIRERRIATKESNSEMAAIAAKRALEQSGVQAQEIDLILMATSSADYCFPNGACEVQAAIGAHNAVCYDISAACSGFIYALNTAHAYICSGIVRTALVIGSDVLSKLIDWTDRSTCVLFGDGAGAAVLRASDHGVLGVKMGSDGSRKDALVCGARTNGNFLLGKKPEFGYMTMDGQEVFKFAVKTVPEVINQLLTDTNTDKSEIKYFVLHQANHRIIESVAKRLRVDISRFPANMERYGNTSGGSVPLLLDEINRRGELQRGDKIMLAGFGAGLTWGATLIEW